MTCCVSRSAATNRVPLCSRRRDFNVQGIPEYVWVDASGRPRAVAVGRLPKEVLAANTEALLRGGELPYAKVQGTASDIREGQPTKSQNPLDHA